MKLILTTEVDHLGSAGDTVEVRDGYGRNYLLPRGLAIAAALVLSVTQPVLAQGSPQKGGTLVIAVQPEPRLDGSVTRGARLVA